jgi:nucleoside-diphosphate-sugar epimerase
MTIAILGASGHVGQRIVRRLLASPAEVVERVITLDRRVVDGFPAEDRLCNHVVDMGCADALQCAAAPLLAGVDVVVATMGVGSGFGSIAEFRRVEVALPAAFARAAAGAGVKRAVLLTAAGADVDRGFSFLLPHVARGQYFHLKGLVEQHFADAGFAEGVVVFRPGGLLGTTHLPEWIDAVLVRVDWMWPVHFRCIHIAQLADAMARAAIGPAPGEHGATTVVQGEGLFDLLRADRRAACVAD